MQFRAFGSLFNDQYPIPNNQLVKTKLILIALVLVLIGGIFLYYESKARRVQSEDVVELVKIQIPENANLKEIENSLILGGALDKNKKTAFSYYALTRGLKDKFQAGKYLIDPSSSPASIANKIASGDILQEVQVTLIEGWTAKEMAQQLAENEVVDGVSFLEAVEKDWSGEFEWTKDTDSVEGFLFPDTYRFYLGSTGDDVVRKMLENFEAKALPAVQSGNSDLSLHEVVILASIVQNEVSKEEDMKIVAGIFLSRLELGKPLESDATVNYVTGKGLTQPTLEDTEVDSPYNTYNVEGLPPGPIGNPGILAIQAALEPQDSPFLYFLTTEDGETIFSQTYEEHLENKERYLD